jgi:hypothetical protein
MVSLPIFKIITYGLLAATAFVFFNRARQPNVGLGVALAETGAGIGAAGGGLGEIGKGIRELLGGIGAGSAKLFDPLFTLRDLVFPPTAGNQPAPTAATAGQIPAQTPPLTTPIPQSMPTTPTQPPASSTSTLPPSAITPTEAAYLTAQGFGFNPRIQPQKTLSLIKNTSYTVRNEQTQLYLNKRNEIVRTTPTTAAKLVQRGYLQKI